MDNDTTTEERGIEQPEGAASPWPRKKVLTPEEYVAFAQSLEMRAARAKAIHSFGQIAPAEARNAIARILGDLTNDTIDAYFTYDEEAVSAALIKARPDLAEKFEATKAAAEAQAEVMKTKMEESLAALGITATVKIEKTEMGLAIVVDGKDSNDLVRATEVLEALGRDAVPADPTQH